MHILEFFFLVAFVEACRRNIQFNGSVAISKVDSHLVDAHVYMLENPKEFKSGVSSLNNFGLSKV